MNLIRPAFLTLLLVISLPALSAVDKRYSRSFKDKDSDDNDRIRSEIGLNIPEWGIAIDATFNPQLTNIIPGYHIVTIVLTNRRSEPVMLDARKDKWIIVDNLGKKHRAFNHVKQFNRDIWSKMPRKLKLLLDYPHVVNPGKSTTIDVFLPKSVDLFNFREIVWESAHFNKEFNMFTAYEKSLSIPTNPREFDTPKKTITEEELLKREERLQQQQQQQDKYQETLITPEDANPNVDEIIESGKNPPATVEGFIRIK